MLSSPICVLHQGHGKRPCDLRAFLLLMLLSKVLLCLVNQFSVMTMIILYKTSKGTLILRTLRGQGMMYI